MAKKIVVFDVNDKIINSGENNGFEGELGWLLDSGISVDCIYEIPDETTIQNPFEAALLIEQIHAAMQKYNLDLDTNRIVEILNYLQGRFPFNRHSLFSLIDSYLENSGWLQQNNNIKKVYRASNYTVKGMENVFLGYSCDCDENGWDFPYFPKESAEKLKDYFKDWNQDPSQSFYYLEERDSYILSSGDLPFAEEYRGMDVFLNGEIIRVYPIGTHIWEWNEVKPSSFLKEEVAV